MIQEQAPVAIETIRVPDIGDAKEVEVIELLVTVGQTVAENDSLLVLESDKAAMEIPAPKAGVVKSILVNLGDQVTTGSDMLTLEVEAVTNQAKPTAIKKQEAAKQASPQPAPALFRSETVNKGAVASPVSAQTISVPDLGSEDEVEIIEIHVKAGDVVAVEESLITLESDKAAMDVPSPLAGTIESVLVKVGDKVKTGTPFAKLLSIAGQEPAIAESNSVAVPQKVSLPVTPSAVVAPKSTPSSTPSTKPTGETLSTEFSGGSTSRPYAGPAVRKLAREFGVDLTQVKGTGTKSRIQKEDLHEFVKARINTPTGAATTAVSAIPDIDFSQFGEIEQVPRSKLQRLTAVNMHRSWTSVPHVAQFNEADVTDLEEFREGLKAEADRKGAKITFLPFLLKACAKALREYPQFNVSLHSSGEYVIQKKYVHIGIAVATDAGLVVPVIRNADQKSIWTLGAEAAELAEKAKQRKLKPEDMQGACFTISSLGAIGGTGFIPIVNAPEVAIVGVGKTQIKPVFIDGQFVPRKMLPFTLSYDHKALNGVDGGLFSTYLAKLLSDIRHLAL